MKNIYHEQINNLFEKSKCLDLTPESFANDIDSITHVLKKYLFDLNHIGCFNNNYSEKMDENSNIFNMAIKQQLKGGIETTSGHFMGYIPGGGLLTSSYADLITAVTNKYSALSYAAPGAANTENIVIKWMTNLFGFNDKAWGVLTSGGTSATLNCFMAALETIKQEDRSQLVFYISDQTHHCVQKVLKVMGFSQKNIRYIKTEKQKIIIEDIKKQIKKDHLDNYKPFLIVATVGTTNSGSIDPIIELSNISKKEKMWLHIDAAYGGFFKMSLSKRNELKFISQADSMIVDPHKGLFLSYGVGAALVKDGELLRKSCYESPSYFQDTIYMDDRSPSDYSFELTRHNRALRVKLSLDYFGEDKFETALEEKLLLAKYLYLELEKLAGIQLLNEPELTIVLFRFDSCKKTKKVLYFINNSGSFISSTIIDKQFWMRACLLSFRTHIEHVDTLICSVKRGLKIHE